MKHNYLLLTLIALVTSFHIYAPEEGLVERESAIFSKKGPTEEKITNAIKSQESPALETGNVLDARKNMPTHDFIAAINTSLGGKLKLQEQASLDNAIENASGGNAIDLNTLNSLFVALGKKYTKGSFDPKTFLDGLKTSEKGNSISDKIFSAFNYAKLQFSHVVNKIKPLKSTVYKKSVYKPDPQSVALAKQAQEAIDMTLPFGEENAEGFSPAATEEQTAAEKAAAEAKRQDLIDQAQKASDVYDRNVKNKKVTAAQKTPRKPVPADNLLNELNFPPPSFTTITKIDEQKETFQAQGLSRKIKTYSPDSGFSLLEKAEPQQEISTKETDITTPQEKRREKSPDITPKNPDIKPNPEATLPSADYLKALGINPIATTDTAADIKAYADSFIEKFEKLNPTQQRIIGTKLFGSRGEAYTKDRIKEILNLPDTIDRLSLNERGLFNDLLINMTDSSKIKLWNISSSKDSTSIIFSIKKILTSIATELKYPVLPKTKLILKDPSITNASMYLKSLKITPIEDSHNSVDVQTYANKLPKSLEKLDFTDQIEAINRLLSTKGTPEAQAKLKKILAMPDTYPDILEEPFIEQKKYIESILNRMSDSSSQRWDISPRNLFDDSYSSIISSLKKIARDLTTRLSEKNTSYNIDSPKF